MKELAVVIASLILAAGCCLVIAAILIEVL